MMMKMVKLLRDKLDEEQPKMSGMKKCEVACLSSACAEQALSPRVNAGGLALFYVISHSCVSGQSGAFDQFGFGLVQLQGGRRF